MPPGVPGIPQNQTLSYNAGILCITWTQTVTCANFSYEITCEKGLQGGALTLTKSFLQYTASDSAQGMLSGIGYVPLPASLLTKVNSSVNSIS
jgi:hypothetical protein